MRYCTNCGKELSEGLKFCVHCGAPVKPINKPQDNTQMNQQERPQTNQQERAQASQQERPHANQQGRPQMRQQGRSQMNQRMNGQGHRPTPPPRRGGSGNGGSGRNKGSNKTPIIILSIILAAVVIASAIVIAVFVMNDSDKETANDSNNSTDVSVTNMQEDQTPPFIETTMAPYTEQETEYQQPTQRATSKPKKPSTSSGKMDYRVAPTGSIGDDYFYDYFDYKEDILCATILAINEYYARAGCKFKTKQLQKYFNNQKWYKNKGKAATKSVLSGTAKKNVKKLYSDRDYYKKDLGVNGLAEDYTYDEFVDIAKQLN